VVFCSSKTGAEILRLSEGLGLFHPFIAENGGGIFVPEGFFGAALPELPLAGRWRVLRLGTARGILVQALAEVRRELGLVLRGFSDMSVEEVARLCALSRDDARLAMQRHFDEPFVAEIENGESMRKMAAAFGERGLRVTRGGRFFHLTGMNDKGLAVRRLNELFLHEHAAIQTFGVGDCANDLPMLAAVDQALLVQKPDGTYDESICAGLPGVRRISGIGPAGWARAVMDVAQGLADQARPWTD
jgi:mannosyl-3-phosphoglycerate phosphatase